MNKKEIDILCAVGAQNGITQRELAERSGYSVGIVNQCLHALVQQGYLNEEMDRLTEKAKAILKKAKPCGAIILAAGFGMRMVPINTETPKGLLEIHGQTLIERLIEQLHEAGIYNITVVVGFMKEAYEYLIDSYGVQLVVNRDYAQKNNLYSLLCVKDKLANSYVMPCDIWCKENPFRQSELYSWYMVSDQCQADSSVRVNRARELVPLRDKKAGNRMIGIAYFTKEDAIWLCEQITCYAQRPGSTGAFWEEAVFAPGNKTLAARCVRDDEVAEINTYEQLREMDAGSIHLHSKAIQAIARALQVKEDEVREITILKKGMTNRSFLFSCQGKRYIMRVPGEGTDQLINRRQEAAVYCAIAGKGLCDDPVYIDPETGYKITAFLESVRNCDPFQKDDLKVCMKKLKKFHDMRLQVDHEFDIFGQIEFYENLWGGVPSVYRDYKQTKKSVLALRPYIERYAGEKVLTHIDAVPDNFLFYKQNGQELLQLTDWEYAGMQDPHVDIAMFCIYSLYDREQVDQLIDIYFENTCPREIRLKIYCYIAACGLLWSNWCEYKRSLGVEFGEYSLRQYRYAKEYSRLFQQEISAIQSGKALV